MLRLLWLTLACLWLCPGAALALDPDKRLSQYAHSAWRIQDGSFGGAPSAVVQTADGYVWIGTSTGLLRFDGMRFVQWIPGDGGSFVSSNSVYSLLGELDPAIDLLERLLLHSPKQILWIRNDSDLDPIRNHPRYQRLLETIGD